MVEQIEFEIERLIRQLETVNSQDRHLDAKFNYIMSPVMQRLYSMEEYLENRVSKTCATPTFSIDEVMHYMRRLQDGYIENHVHFQKNGKWQWSVNLVDKKKGINVDTHHESLAIAYCMTILKFKWDLIKWERHVTHELKVSDEDQKTLENQTNLIEDHSKQG